MTKPITTSKRLSSSLEIRVRFNEVDSLGIVWHGHYINYFEQGRECFGQEHGISYLDVQRNGFATPIVKSSCEHFLPLKYGETVKVITSFINDDAAKMTFEFELFNSEQKLVCRGKTVQVFIDTGGNLQLYSPRFFQDWKSKMQLL